MDSELEIREFRSVDELMEHGTPEELVVFAKMCGMTRKQFLSCMNRRERPAFRELWNEIVLDNSSDEV